MVLRATLGTAMVVVWYGWMVEKSGGFVGRRVGISEAVILVVVVVQLEVYNRSRRRVNVGQRRFDSGVSRGWGGVQYSLQL